MIRVKSPLNNLQPEQGSGNMPSFEKRPSKEDLVHKRPEQANQEKAPQIKRPGVITKTAAKRIS